MKLREVELQTGRKLFINPSQITMVEVHGSGDYLVWLVGLREEIAVKKQSFENLCNCMKHAPDEKVISIHN